MVWEYYCTKCNRFHTWGSKIWRTHAKYMLITKEEMRKRLRNGGVRA
jgi:hypothetical protein